MSIRSQPVDRRSAYLRIARRLSPSMVADSVREVPGQRPPATGWAGRGLPFGIPQPAPRREAGGSAQPLIQNPFPSRRTGICWHGHRNRVPERACKCTLARFGTLRPDTAQVQRSFRPGLGRQEGSSDRKAYRPASLAARATRFPGCTGNSPLVRSIWLIVCGTIVVLPWSLHGPAKRVLSVSGRVPLSAIRSVVT